MRYVYTKEQLALALRVLNNECRSQTVCNQCLLYLDEYGMCALEALDRGSLYDGDIEKIEKGN